MDKKITIRQVAQQAGTSYQTVSRVIKGEGYVAPETRARVLEAIDQLGYIPSGFARAFSSQNIPIIGLVILIDMDFAFQSRHTMETILGINRQVRLREDHLLISTPNSKENNTSAYKALLKERLVKGLIIDCKENDSGPQLLVDHGYPAVILGYTKTNIPCVHSDDRGSAYNLVQHLIALGHRHIGVLGDDMYISTAERLAGFRQAAADCGVTVREDWIIPSDYTIEGGYHAVEALLRHDQPPTAIFALNDRMAHGAMRRLKEAGYVVPLDMSVVGFDDSPLAEMSSPPLTTVQLRDSLMGEQATMLLYEIIANHQPSATEIVLPARIIMRASTTKPRTGPVKRLTELKAAME